MTEGRIKGKFYLILFLILICQLLIGATKITLGQTAKETKRNQNLKTISEINSLIGTETHRKNKQAWANRQVDELELFRYLSIEKKKE